MVVLPRYFDEALLGSQRRYTLSFKVRLAAPPGFLHRALTVNHVGVVVQDECGVFGALTDED